MGCYKDPRFIKINILPTTQTKQASLADLPSFLSMVPDHSVVSAQIPGGDPAQLHGQLLDQAFVSRGLKPDSVPGVTGQLLICSDSGQNDLHKSETSLITSF